eukprot:COSAG04_NODE_4807_length_1885_cov_1.627100_1_plen_517_part_10
MERSGDGGEPDGTADEQPMNVRSNPLPGGQSELVYTYGCAGRAAETSPPWSAQLVAVQSATLARHQLQAACSAAPSSGVRAKALPQQRTAAYACVERTERSGAARTTEEPGPAPVLPDLGWAGSALRTPACNEAIDRCASSQRQLRAARCHATVMLNHVSSVALLEGKVSYSAPFGPKTQSNNLILAVVFGGIVPFWVWRRGIYGLITRPCVGKQRLADGAFIAALLLAMDEGDGDGDGGGEKQDRDLVADAAVLMRRIPMSRVTLQMLGASPRDENYDASASYSMGEACGLGGCDFFVSHSWGDDPRAKYAQLMAVTLLFRRKHGRDPTLWLDKCCTPIISLDIDMVPFRFFKRRVCGSAGINQEDIARTLRCLPVFVQSCSKLLILSGDSYANRLWCAWELYVHFAMSGVHASKRTAVVDCRSNKEQGARTDSTATSDSVVVVDNPTAAETSEPAAVEATGPAEAGPAEALCTFRVEDAHCFSPEDEARLRRVIESESAESFNNAIREAGQAVAL